MIITGDLDNCKVSVLRHNVVTADNNGTSVDFFDANGQLFNLFVSIAASPTGTVTVTIQGSDDNSTWATLHDFGSLGAGLATQVVKRTYRYLRCKADVGADTQEHNICCLAIEQLARS